MAGAIESCDHCGAGLHHDENGFWVDSAGSSDCDDWPGGHTVAGQPS